MDERQHGPEDLLAARPASPASRRRGSSGRRRSRASRRRPGGARRPAAWRPRPRRARSSSRMRSRAAPGDDRPDIDDLARVPSPTTQLPGLGLQAPTDRSRALPDGDDDRAGHAALAGGAERAAEDAADGLVDHRVGHDDHVVLGAAERLNALARLRRALVDDASHVVTEPTNETASMSGWSRMPSTTSRPPLTRFTTPGGSPSLVEHSKAICSG